MAESLIHRNLVLELKKHILNTYNDLSSISIYTDIDTSKYNPSPIRIQGKIPDLYALTHSNNHQIIGEAKTVKRF